MAFIEDDADPLAHPDDDLHFDRLVKYAEEDVNDAAMRLLRQRKEVYWRVRNGVPFPGDMDFFMEDLARFCRAHKSTFHENPYVAARLDGRREVFLRILDFTGLSLDALYKKYHGS
jgi:hypothetical protein